MRPSFAPCPCLAIPNSRSRAGRHGASVAAGALVLALLAVLGSPQARAQGAQGIVAQSIFAQDVLVFSASQAFRYESNLLRLPSGLSAAAATGGAATSRSDLVSTTTIGARFAREFSLQHVRADATVYRTRFLLKDTELHVVEVGDVIDERYRVDSISGAQMTLVFLPLQAAQTLTIGSVP